MMMRQKRGFQPLLGCLALIALPLFGCGETDSSSLSSSDSTSSEEICSVISYEQNVSASFEMDVIAASALFGYDDPQLSLAFEDYASLEEVVYEEIPEEYRGSNFESDLSEIEAHYEETGDYLFLVTQSLGGSHNLGRGFVFEDDTLICFTYYDCYETLDEYSVVDVVAVSRDMVGDLGSVEVQRLSLSGCDPCSFYGYC